jgi:hypothetical protein
MRRVILALAAVACRTPAPAVPKVTEIAQWIPKDALIVIAVRDASVLPRVDAVARALGVQPPGELLGDRGLAWMMLADHTIVRCYASSAPDGVNAGLVVRGGVACEVKAQVGSIRDKDAALLWNLRANERAAIAPPAAPLWAWGHGQVIGSGIDAYAMQALDGRTLAIGVDVVGATLTVTGLPGAGTIAMGEHAEEQPPDPAAIPDDANADVPLSEEYTAAKKEIDQLDPIAAWHAAWGTAKVDAGTLTWTMPAAAAELRAKAQTAYDQVAGARSRAIDALLRIRARDVAAWDKAHE